MFVRITVSKRPTIPPVPQFQNEPSWSGGVAKRLGGEEWRRGRRRGGSGSPTDHPGLPQALPGTEEPPPGRKGPQIFEESALWADSFYKSKGLCVCLFVCLSVTLCIHCLNIFVPPLPKIKCQNFFRYTESLGKSAGNKWSQI